MFTMIWRLALGALMTALIARKAALLIERIAVDQFGPFDTTALFYGSLVVLGAVGILSTLQWAGLILKDADAPAKQ